MESSGDNGRAIEATLRRRSRMWAFVCLLLTGSVVGVGLLVVLALNAGGDNRWTDRSFELGSAPTAAERVAFLDGVRADAVQFGTDHSAIPDLDLIDAARFVCAAMVTVRTEDHRTPKQDDLDDAVSAAMERFDFTRAKVRMDDDPHIVNRDPKDVDVALGYAVAGYGFGIFCPQESPDLRR